MAKKSKSSPVLLIVVVGIGLLMILPPEAWILFGAIGAVVLGVWWLNRNTPEERPPSPSFPAKREALKQTATGSQPSMPRTARPAAEEDFSSFHLGGATSAAAGFRIPQPPADAISARWIPPGVEISVGAFSIPLGMLYISTGTRRGHDRPDPGVIDPKLKLSNQEVDWSQSLMGYWPSYSSISPEARRAYLQWLSDGRKAPEADISLVFLFFYGLERRVLIDFPSDPTISTEIDLIATEVSRLLRVYGDNHSFRRYASQFLEFLDASNTPSITPAGPPLEVLGRVFELPLKLKLGLGQFATTQTPLPAEWALAWALSDPNIRRRTPVQRCEHQFAQLFSKHYSEAYGGGLVLKRNRTKLKIEYRPASSALMGSRFRVELGDIPDVSAVRTPIQKLQTLVDECTTALDPYSRFIGRNPDKAHSLEGLLQLPVELWPLEVKAELDNLKQRIGDGMVLMSFGELSGMLKSAGPLSRDKVLGLGRALESLYLGMEPDVLGGRKPPRAEEKVALFATHPEDGNSRSAPAYQAAAVTLDLACMTLYADGEASTHELVALTRHIDAWTHLSAAHRKRLKAHLRLGIDQPLTLASVKKKLEPLAPEAKRSIARLLAHLTQADGVVTPAEVKFLERAYKSLGLDTQLVYSDLHANDPVPATTTTLIPNSSSNDQPATQPGFVLDAARIAQLEHETAEVSALLAGVFVEDEEVRPEVVTNLDSESDGEAAEIGIMGLGADDIAFLRVLITRSSWPRSELADVATDMELMLDGTLEQINDATFDAFDASLTEGDDPIEINQEVLETLPI